MLQCRMHKGSCLCGAVRFTVAVDGPLPGPDACHCTACRKSSGHFFVSTDVPRSRTKLAVHVCVEEKGDYYALDDGLPQHAVVRVHIARPMEVVYAFASDPVNLPRWAAGLARSEVEPDVDGWWIAQAPMGRVRVRFAPPNPDGVMDHDVELQSGEVVHNRLRVAPEQAGSTVTFILVRPPGMTQQQFEDDRRAVEADLASLKRLLEGR